MSIQSFPAVASDGSRLSNPSNPIGEGFSVSTASIKFDSSHEQRRTKGAPLATFSLNYVAIRDIEYQTLRNFFIANTDVKSFMWTHPMTKQAYKCRFDGASFSATSIGHNGATNIWACKFNLVQVL